MAGLRQLTRGGEKMFTLGKQFTIGRDQGNDLVLDEPQVSRWHATIREDLDNGGYVLEDRLSTHGTFLQRGAAADPSRITQPQPLRSNDVIRIGQTRLIFDETIHA